MKHIYVDNTKVAWVEFDDGYNYSILESGFEGIKAVLSSLEDETVAKPLSIEDIDVEEPLIQTTTPESFMEVTNEDRKSLLKSYIAGMKNVRIEEVDDE